MNEEPSNDELIELGKKREKNRVRDIRIVSGIILLLCALSFTIMGATFISDDSTSGGGIFLSIGIVCAVIYVLVFVITGRNLKRKLSNNIRLAEIGREEYIPLKNVANRQISKKITSVTRETGLKYYSNNYYLFQYGIKPNIYANAGLYENKVADVLFDEFNQKFIICTPQENVVFSHNNIFYFDKIIACNLNDKGHSASRNTEDPTTAYMLGGFVGMAISKTRNTTVVDRVENYVVDVVYDDLQKTSLSFEFGSNRALAEKLANYFIIIAKRNNSKINAEKNRVYDDVGDSGDVTLPH